MNRKVLYKRWMAAQAVHAAIIAKIIALPLVEGDVQIGARQFVVD